MIKRTCISMMCTGLVAVLFALPAGETAGALPVQAKPSETWCIWNGSVSNDWNNPDNWLKDPNGDFICNAPVGIPGPTDYVQIPTFGVSHDPLIDSNVTVRYIEILSGRTLSLNGDVAVSQTFLSLGVVSGNGSVTAQGDVDVSVSGIFDVSLVVASGITRAEGTFGGPISVQQDATLVAGPLSSEMVATSVTTILGTFIVSGNFYVRGPSIYNHGQIEGRVLYFDSGSGTRIYGAGRWLNVNLVVAQGALAYLDGDVTLEGNSDPYNWSSLDVLPGGTLDLEGHALTFSGTTQAVSVLGVVPSGGSMRIAGDLASLSSSGSSYFAAELEFASGTTTIDSAIVYAPISVASGAILQVNDGLIANGNLIVSGLLTDVPGSSNYGRVTFRGATFINDGIVDVFLVEFAGPATQNLGGSGVWLPDGILEIASLTSLDNDISLFRDVWNYGTFNLGSHNLTITDASFDNYNVVLGGGTIMVQGDCSFTNSGEIQPMIQIIDGTTSIFSAAAISHPTVLRHSGDAVFSAMPNVRSARPRATMTSAGSYGSILVGPDGTLVFEGDVIVAGDLTNSGTILPDLNEITLDCVGNANLILIVPTSFHDLTVGSECTLSVTGSYSISGSVTNLGSTVETAHISGPGPLTFVLAGVFINITDQGSLSGIEVAHHAGDAPNATVLTATGTHWAITPTGIGYILDLTLPRPAGMTTNVLACRNGASTWDCACSGASPSSVTRSGITQLSYWAVGTGAGITTIQDIAQHWGATTGTPNFDPLFDMDRNGVIDIRDIILVTSLWNGGC